jgi:type II secretory pathway pseudopilin PulG
MHPSRRRGFALMYVLLALAVAATVAAVAAPSLIGARDRARVLESAKRLSAISAGIRQFAAVVGHYPGTVSELTIPITTASTNSCGQPMSGSPNGDVASWAAGMAYSPYYADDNGPWTPIGRIKNAIPTRPQGGKNPLFIDVDGVSATDAALLATLVDGLTGDTVTALHAPVNDTTTIRYRAVSIGVALAGC